METLSRCVKVGLKLLIYTPLDDGCISDAYSSYLSRAKNLLASRRFPTTALSLIESDISTTLPQLHIFHRQHGPLYDDLYSLLCAWVISRADEGLGYVEGIAKVQVQLIC